MIDYLKENTDFSFKDWQCVTVLCLPNSNKSYDPIPYKPSIPYAPSQHSHLVLNKIDLNIPNKILTKFQLSQKFEIDEEYEVLAAISMAALHSAAILNLRGPPLLEAEGHSTHVALSGGAARPDGPGFNVDKLPDDVIKYTKTEPTYEDLKADKKQGKEKEPANSYAAWLFWNPSQ